MLPRIHPLIKTHTELKRCEIRLDEFVARFPEDETNEVERYMKIISLIQQARELIPEQYNGRS